MDRSGFILLNIKLVYCFMPNIKCKTLENNNPDYLMKLAFLCIKTILRFRKLLVDYLFMFFLYPCRIKDQSYFFALHFRLWLFIALWLCTQTAHWMSPCLFGTLGTKYFWKKEKTDFSEVFFENILFLFLSYRLPKKSLPSNKLVKLSNPTSCRWKLWNNLFDPRYEK